mgnify:CR=1 FL=1
MTLREDILTGIQQVASRFPIDKVILFGSRAKDTCWEYSDVDLAISGKLDADAYFDFKEELEKYPDLYLFDVVDMNSDFIDADLMNEIAKDGVMIYEKVRTDETSV